MKKVAASLLITFIAATAQAGSFGGPPPFTNGSPLPSGVDGSYQAALKGKNLNGIVRFSYSGGSQIDVTVEDNAYFIFYAGQIYQQAAQVAIMDSQISAILEETFPSLFSGLASGYFSAKLQTKSAFGNFSGKGRFTVTDTTPVPPLVDIITDIDFRVNGMRTVTGSASN